MKKILWTEEELILTLDLYKKIPYEDMHIKNNAVISLSRMINRSTGSVVLRLMNYGYLDPIWHVKGRKGLDGGYSVCKPIWEKYYNNHELLNTRVEEIIRKFEICKDSLCNNNSQIVKGEIIWKAIINGLMKFYEIEWSGSNPYWLLLNGAPYYVFVRNLTRAYTDRSPDVCRIQLHKSPKFEVVKNSDIALIVLGYCDKYKTLASWPSNGIKPRLNGKGNVSLYSRFSKQKTVETGKIRIFMLDNGEVINVLNLDDIYLLFPPFNEFAKREKGIVPTNLFRIETEINYEVLSRLLSSVIHEPSDINAIKICIKYLEDNYIEYDLLMVRDIINQIKTQYQFKGKVKS